MITSSNGNIFRVTGPLCAEFPSQRPVRRSFAIFLDLCLNKRLSKQLPGWWLRRHRAHYDMTVMRCNKWSVFSWDFVVWNRGVWVLKYTKRRGVSKQRSGNFETSPDLSTIRLRRCWNDRLIKNSVHEVSIGKTIYNVCVATYSTLIKWSTKRIESNASDKNLLEDGVHSNSGVRTYHSWNMQEHRGVNECNLFESGYKSHKLSWIELSKIFPDFTWQFNWHECDKHVQYFSCTFPKVWQFIWHLIHGLRVRPL